MSLMRTGSYLYAVVAHMCLLWYSSQGASYSGIQVTDNGTNSALHTTRLLSTQNDAEYRIRINQNFTAAINLAEVQLYSHGTLLSPVAYNLSSIDGFDASFCFDNNVSTYCASHDASHLDAVSFQEITQVVVINRVDARQDQIVGATITFYRDNVTYDEGVFAALQTSYSFGSSVRSTVPLYRIRIEQASAATYIYLADVQLYSHGVEVSPLVYMLSSTLNPSTEASQCFDGNANTMCHSLHANGDDYLEISVLREITQVVVTNRVDCCQSNIVGASMTFYRNDALFDVGAFTASQASYSFGATFSSTVPLYRIRIEAPVATSLNLGEVQLYSHGVQVSPQAYALSSTFPPNTANLCFDGNANTMCHSVDDDGDSLDISVLREITQVVVTNRVDAEQDRIVGATIMFYRNEVLYGNGSFETQQSSYTFHAEANATAEYRVRITVLASTVINLGEVQLYSHGVQVSPQAYALSSTLGTNPANLCFDGNANTYCHSVDGAGDYLEATASVEITQVVVINRVDAAQDRIVGASIVFYRDDVSYANDTFMAQAASYDFYSDPHQYRVRITLPVLASPINLGEVQLYISGTLVSPTSYSLSSTLSLNPVNLCFDGNVNTYCHSMMSNNDYLEIITSQELSEVVVTNRVDSSQERILGGTIVFYRDSIPYERGIFDSISPYYNFKASLPSKPLYHIRISQPATNLLNLGEVQLFSHGLEVSPVAFSLSSADGTLHPPRLCFDGNSNTYCASADGSGDFLDVTSAQEITEVVVTNREDGGQALVVGATITFYRDSLAFVTDTFVAEESVYSFFTRDPTSQPSAQPSSLPTQPSSQPSSQPSTQPSSLPSALPSSQPSLSAASVIELRQLPSFTVECGFAFAAMTSGGAVITWGKLSRDDYPSTGDVSTQGRMVINSSAVEIVASRTAYAARTTNGGIIAWGVAAAYAGADVYSAPAVPIHTLVGNQGAFAGIDGNGGVVAFGGSGNGNNVTESGYLQQLSSNVTSIVASAAAFAALKPDGSVYSWGNIHAGAGVSSETNAELLNIVHVAATSTAFAALLSSGQVVAWGGQYSGGDTSSVSSALQSDVVHVLGLVNVFVAFKSKYGIVVWGNPESGGDASSMSAELRDTPIASIAYTSQAIAALTRNGSVISWGKAGRGGDASAVQSQLVNVTAVVGNKMAFAAITGGGRVVAWGEAVSGGAIPAALTGSLSQDVVSIRATNRAFAALKSTGEVVVWGVSFYGGSLEGSSGNLASHLSSGVTLLCSNEAAFTAIKAGEGRAVAWGHSSSIPFAGLVTGVDFTNVTSCK